MIEVRDDQLVFSFPQVHPQAKLRIDFQRTLRIPDDGKTYPLPPGLGRFPLSNVDEFVQRVPSPWLEHGGVMLPMYQSEALWILFQPEFVQDRWTGYPFAIKVATGKICAVSGKDWAEGLRLQPQDYAVAPLQPWLDGYCVEKGSIRQFVAMPLGAGYTAEEQITGEAKHGGLQIVVYPMKREVFEKRFPVQSSRNGTKGGHFVDACLTDFDSADMGLAPGGLMHQEIYEDPYALDDWDQSHPGRCFVHIANSLVWRAITGSNPPTPPPTAAEYTQFGLPWFDYYSDTGVALPGATILQKLKSVVTLGKEKGDVPLPENASVWPQRIIKLRAGMTKDQVREGTF